MSRKVGGGRGTSRACEGEAMKELEIRRVAAYRCRYYVGWDKPICKAGVDLHKLIDVSRPGSGHRMPCLGPDKFVEEGQQKAICEQYSLLTEEEVEKEVRENSQAEREVAAITAYRLTMEALSQSPRIGSESRTFPCPRCNNTTLEVVLSLTRKFAGRCKAKNCTFAFIE